MKAKALQFGKAMSAALFVLLLSVAGMKNALAQTQVATLQHGDDMSAFYGANALVEAHAAATAGDIITLSSGTFNSCDITKSITIRGAGCVYDSLTQVTPTIIPGVFEIRSSNNSFEGIKFSGTIKSSGRNNISFTKCNVDYIELSHWQNNMNWQFVNCIIKTFDPSFKSTTYAGTSYYSFVGMSIINSVVKFVGYDHTDITAPTTISNSIILVENGDPVKNIIAYNSIVATVSENEVSNCTFFNCIGIETGETLLFEGQTTHNVMEVNGYEDVFETFDGTVAYDNIYQLKEEIANSFLGNDGSEVGLFGGIMPYNPRPSYMIMKHCNVAPRSTVDGKLSVDIEIIAEDE